ncbi:hypothetical protein [Shewanella sp.]|uniref:hypothetical protein n=1 Tax=Shewanella sp. TaxID=50422 RepID=UPI003569A1D9
MTTGFLGSFNNESSANSFGLPSFANCIISNIKNVPSKRFITINDGTRDCIRLPKEFTGTSMSVGYRRVDAKGSSGVSEWLVTAQMLADYVNVTSTGFVFGHAHIQNDNLYILCNPKNRNNTFSYSYIFKINVNTGAIVSAYSISGSAISNAINGMQANYIFFDVSSDETTISFLTGTEYSSATTTHKVRIFTWDFINDVKTSDVVIFEYVASASDYYLNDIVPTYLSADGHFSVLRSNNAVFLVHDEFGPVIVSENDSDKLFYFVSRTTNSSMNMVVDNKIFQGREYSDSLNSSPDSIIDTLYRSEFDKYLKLCFEKLTGIIL